MKIVLAFRHIPYQFQLDHRAYYNRNYIYKPLILVYSVKGNINNIMCNNIPPHIRTSLRDILLTRKDTT